MAKLKVTYNPVTQVANVLNPAAGAPVGSTDLGVIDHDPSHITDAEDPLKHVLFQTVQNKLLLSGVLKYDNLTIVVGL
jgi:hypothetical protein